MVGLVQFIPMFLLTLLVGYAADRYNRKLIICLCQIIQMAGIFSLAYLSYRGMLTEGSILGIIFFIAIANAFQGPPLQALLPNIVSKELFPQAAALSASAFQFAVILGPALGGLLYAFGPTAVYCIAGVFPLLTGMLVSNIVVTQEYSRKTSVNIKSLFAGIAFIRSKLIVLGAISLDLFAVLFGGATALLPIFASNILLTGPLGLGFLRSAPAVGALVMSIFLARRPLKKMVGHTMFAAVIIYGICTVLFALSTSFALSIMILFLIGAADVISVVIRATLIQIQTPDEMRGRVSSVNLMFIGTSNQLGEFESGITAALFGAVPAVIVGGIGTIIIVLMWIKLFPDLWNVDKLDHSKNT
jgi:MFS family permease